MASMIDKLKALIMRRTSLKGEGGSCYVYLPSGEIYYDKKKAFKALEANEDVFRELKETCKLDNETEGAFYARVKATLSSLPLEDVPKSACNQDNDLSDLTLPKLIARRKIDGGNFHGDFCYVYIPLNKVFNDREVMFHFLKNQPEEFVHLKKNCQDDEETDEAFENRMMAEMLFVPFEQWADLVESDESEDIELPTPVVPEDVEIFSYKKPEKEKMLSSQKKEKKKVKSKKEKEKKENNAPKENNKVDSSKEKKVDNTSKVTGNSKSRGQGVSFGSMRRGGMMRSMEPLMMRRMVPLGGFDMDYLDYHDGSPRQVHVGGGVQLRGRGRGGGNMNNTFRTALMMNSGGMNPMFGRGGFRGPNWAARDGPPKGTWSN